MKRRLRCCMKAAPSHFGQMIDKVNRLKELYRDGINSSKKALIELHIIDLMNPEFRKKSVENCRSLADEAEYAVHAQVLLEPEYSVEFCHEIGAKSIVIHRFYDLETSYRAQAVEKFNRYVITLAEDNPGLEFCIENVGFFRLISPEHFFLRDRIKKDYLVNTLNHFFPWEIRDFVEATKNVRNLGVCFDSAHAAISANIFNYLKETGYIEERFSDVTRDDLEQVEMLEPIDFLRAVGDKLFRCHFGDAYLYRGGNLAEYHITEEGLQIGDGDINFTDIIKLINNDRVWWVAEISKVKDYSSAVEMEECFRKLFALYNSHPKGVGI